MHVSSVKHISHKLRKRSVIHRRICVRHHSGKDKECLSLKPRDTTQCVCRCNRQFSGADTGFRKGGIRVKLLTTEMWCIRVHACDVFSLFMKFGGPPKGGLDPQDPPPPLDPSLILLECAPALSSLIRDYLPALTTQSTCLLLLPTTCRPTDRPTGDHIPATLATHVLAAKDVLIS